MVLHAASRQPQPAANCQGGACDGVRAAFKFGEAGCRHEGLDRQDVAPDRRRALSIALGGTAVGRVVALGAFAP